MFKNYQNYEVFENGQIWSYKTNKFLKPKTNHNGYQQVGLVDNEGKRKWYMLHRVVYESVTGEPIPDGMQVNHLNEDKTDNRFFENLNLMTPKENCNFGTRNERLRKAQINGVRSKAVGAFKDGNLVMTFPSTKEAQRQGFNNGHISECCNGKLTHYKGYEWRYI